MNNMGYNPHNFHMRMGPPRADLRLEMSPIHDDDDEMILDSDCLSPCNMMEDVGLDDIELVKISTKDLNRHLKKKGIEKNRQKEVKARRRTLKNRGYAASCRVKRDEEEDNIKKEIEDLDHDVRKEWSITDSSRKEYDMLRSQLRDFGYSPDEIREIRRGNLSIL